MPELIHSHPLPEKDAAAYLGLSVHFLRKRRRLGQEPSFLRLGTRTIRYPISALDDFLRRAEVRRADRAA